MYLVAFHTKWHLKIISGMTESVVAAAASRIGKRVLHLDR